MRGRGGLRRLTHGWAALLAAGIVLGALAAAGPLYASSVATSLVEREVRWFRAEVLGLSVFTSADGATARGLAAADAAVADRLADVPRLTGVETLHGADLRRTDRTDGPGEAVTLLTRTHALDELPGADSGPGVYAPEGFAAAGDRLRVVAPGNFRTGPGEPLTIEVTGTYPPFERGELSDYWQPAAGALVPSSDLPTADVPPPALIVDPATFGQVVEAAGADVTASWTAAAVLDELTYEGLAALLPAYDDLTGDAVDPTTALGGAIASIGRADQGTRTTSSLEPLAERVTAAVRALEGPVRAVGLGGQALAVLVLAAAGAAAARRRAGELRLAVTRGTAPTRLGAAAILPAAVPIGVGAVAGWGAAVATTIALGPATALDPAAVVAALVALGWPLAVGLLLLGAATAAEAVRAARVDPAGGARLRVPADWVAAAAAVAVGWQLRGRSPVVQGDGGAPELDLLLLSFPLLVVVAVSGIGARLVGALLGALRRVPLEHAPGVFLVSRRLAGAGRAPRLQIAVGATALGTLLFAGTLVTSTDATVEEKAGLLVGADLSVPLPRAAQTREALDLSTFDGIPTTTVRRAEARWVADGRGGGVDVDLLVVDPARFATVAAPGRDLGRDGLAALTARLDRAGGAVEVIATDGLGADAGRLVLRQDLDLAVEVAGTAGALPGMAGDRPLVVMAADDFDALAEDLGSPALLAALADPFLWARGRSDVLLAALDDAIPSANAVVAATIRPGTVQTVAAFEQQPAVQAITSTFTLVQVQAAFAGVLALVALLIHQQVGARRRRLAEAFAARMGLSRAARTRAAALEPAVLLGAAVAVGTAAGVLAARLVLDTYDPVPSLAVPSLLVLPAVLLVVVAAVGLVAVALTTVTRRTPTGRGVAELLRAGA